MADSAPAPDPIAQAQQAAMDAISHAEQMRARAERLRRGARGDEPTPAEILARAIGPLKFDLDPDLLPWLRICEDDVTPELVVLIQILRILRGKPNAATPVAGPAAGS